MAMTGRILLESVPDNVKMMLGAKVPSDPGSISIKKEA